MSYHVIHIRTHGSRLTKDRGRLILKSNDDNKAHTPKVIALEDVLAIIVAAKGVTITSSAFAALLKQGSSIVHCDENYQPVGKSLPLQKIIKGETFFNQVEQPKVLNKQIWRILLKTKIANHARVLDSLKIQKNKLWDHLKKTKIDEGNSARYYWGKFFPAIGAGKMLRDRRSETLPNKMLNYGYTILTTLCHQSLIAHGINCQLAVNHIPRYQADPLVYDVVEPYRAYLDIMLAEFYMSSDVADLIRRKPKTDSQLLDLWCRKVGESLQLMRVSYNQVSLTLLNSIDKTAASLSNTYAYKNIDELWLPQLDRTYNDTITK